MSSCSRGGRSRSAEGLAHPAQARVDEPVARRGSARCRRAARAGAGASRPTCIDGLDPVVEQVAVADEDPAAVGDGLAGGALGVQHHVQPAGGEVRRAEPVGVVGLLAADHLGGRPQHRREDRRRAVADRGHPPQAEEPAQPRVLDDQLGVDLRSGSPATRRCGSARARGWTTRPVSNHASGRASLTWTPRLLEQPVVVVDHPRAARRTPWGWSRRRPPRAAARAGP